MKIRRIKVLLAKGWCKVVCFVSFSLLSVVCNHASAQKAGEMISGRITDDKGPLMYANVCERDSLNRIVAHSVTDIEGKFSFRLVNPENTIDVTIIGYETVKFPIDKMYYEIKMERSPEQYLDDIIGSDVEFVDEALTGKVAGYEILFESVDLAYGVPRPQFEEPWSKYLNKNTELTVFLDGTRVKLSYEQKKSFINENTPMDIESLAGLVGVKKSKLKAARLIGPQSEAIVIEVVTKKYYRQLRREGRLDSSYNNLDVF